MLPPIPRGWRHILEIEREKSYFSTLERFLTHDRDAHVIYPPAAETFAALALTAYEHVKVLILGQDPYPRAGQAHGLSFSVRPGVSIPRSLRNIFKELNSDLGCASPEHGCLASWATQGVLLLNSVLTVRANLPNSHKNIGWEQFTDAIIHAINARVLPVVVVLWGASAGRKARLLDGRKHMVIMSAHPSPLSASRGFFGSKPFSQVNAALRGWGHGEVDWELPRETVSFPPSRKEAASDAKTRRQPRA